MNDKQWFESKTPRSVDQLRLWAENPRLNPSNEYIRLRDFAEEFTYEETDRKEFLRLAKLIVDNGFISLDPIVVWQKPSNQKYYVAEGNRRVAALKLLRDPGKAPQSIWAAFRKLSLKIDSEDIGKIPVYVAPNLTALEWYIGQRNSISSSQRKWTNEQQRRWIVELYEKYSGDIDRVTSITGILKGEIESTIRLVNIKNYVELTEVNSKLTDEEYEWAQSYRFPMTILERFFGFLEIRKEWGLEYDGVNVRIISNKQSFYNAFAELIKQIKAGYITTRFPSNTNDLPLVFEKLPRVSFENIEEEHENTQDTQDNQEENKDNTNDNDNEPPINTEVRGNQHRKRLIPKICRLNTSNAKLNELFNELQKLTFVRKHSISVILRVFFDLSISEYIDSERIGDDKINRSGTLLKKAKLKQKLDYIKQHQNLNKPSKRVITRLLNPENDHYSLDTLNGYVHSKKTHYSTKEFLNNFWDFLYPLFEVLLDIKESK